ncbi:MAG TPA: hypothetical protein VJ206_00530 [bacterium]|nr:hypothetical protein [bacterium]
MYVHLGGELVVAVTEVVVVLDARLVAGSPINQEFVRRAEAAGRVRGGGVTAECKSLVVTRDLAVYAAGISPATLTRRMTHLRQSAKAWDAET